MLIFSIYAFSHNLHIMFIFCSFQTDVLFYTGVGIFMHTRVYLYLQFFPIDRILRKCINMRRKCIKGAYIWVLCIFSE